MVPQKVAPCNGGLSCDSACCIGICNSLYSTAGNTDRFRIRTLLDAQIQEVLKDPMKVLEAFKDAKRQLQDKQQKLLDACNKAEKLIKEEKYEEAIVPVDYLLKEMELTEEEKIQMKMTRTALCFSAGRFDEAMEGCTELINLDRSEEGYYYFMFLLHHRLILQ